MILPLHQYLVPLTQDKFAFVDKEGWEKVKHFKWQYSSDGYAVRSGEYVDGVQKRYYMHRILMNTPSGKSTDHINGDKLDNRYCNLRKCTHAENMRNFPPKKGGTSEYKGVSWCNSRNRWVAQIMFNRKNMRIGRYRTEEEAAKAYNEAAKKHFGEFARLNIID